VVQERGVQRRWCSAEAGGAGEVQNSGRVAVQVVCRKRWQRQRKERGR